MGERYLARCDSLLLSFCRSFARLMWCICQGTVEFMAVEVEDVEYKFRNERPFERVLQLSPDSDSEYSVQIKPVWA